MLRIFISFLFLWLWQLPSSFADIPVHIAVGQIVAHPALDSLREGLKEGLKKKRVHRGKKT
ncbi:hypothetical protein QPK87_14330 [Kamptonema cortianum]|nr:hypothetical protein [Kamptonema cortianum]